MSKRLEVIDKMIAAGSNDPFVYYGRAMELKSLGRLDDAMVALELVHARFPTYVPAWHQAGILAREQKQIDRARGFFEKGIAEAKASGNSHALGEMSAELDALAG